MLCKLCKKVFTAIECSNCGLPVGENPIVARLDFGKHKGSSIEEVYKVSPSYLQWMISHKVGTPAQRAKAKLLIAENKSSSNVQTSSSLAPNKSNFDYKYGYMQGPPDLMDVITYQAKTVDVSRQSQTSTRPDFILLSKPVDNTASKRSSFLPSDILEMAEVSPVNEPTQTSRFESLAKSIFRMVRFLFKIFAAASIIVLVLLIIGALVQNISANKSSYSDKYPSAKTPALAPTTAPKPIASPAYVLPTPYIPPTVIVRPTYTSVPSPQQLSAEGKLTFPTLGCVIKGNVSFDTHEAIYHVPGQKYYDATIIDARYGERWFCSEEDALNNGWRKSDS